MENEEGSDASTSHRKEVYSQDGHEVVNWVEPAFHLAKEYKNKFECCVQKILSDSNENCRQDMNNLEQIFDSLWDDHMMLLEKFQDVEDIARKQLIKGNRKLQQTKALHLLEDKTREEEKADYRENSSPLETGSCGDKNSGIDGCCCVSKSCTSVTKLSRMDDELDKAHKEVDRLQIEVNAQKIEITTFQEKISSMAANFKDSKWALVKEVASKHDELMNLQNKIMTIENTLREAERQTHFKEDIIRNLRNEVKLLKERPKLCDVVCEVQNKQTKKMIPSEDDIGSVGVDQPTDNPRICVHSTPEEMASCQRSELCECPTKLANHPSVAPSEDTPTTNELTEVAVHQLDKILEGLRVETNGSKKEQEQNNDPLIPRINMLQHTLFDVILPELRAELDAEKKMVVNKEETVHNLHGMVKMRSEQVEEFRVKVKELEQQLQQQKEVIGELQRAVQNCKQSECELHEKEISRLKFAVCELQDNQKSHEKEMQVKSFEEKLRLKMRLSSVSSQLQSVEPELQASRRLILRAEKYSEELERDLEARHNEITELKEKVQKLEEAAAGANDQSETQRAEISSLKEKVQRLERELSHIAEQYLSLLEEAELRFTAFKFHVSHQYKKLVEKNKMSEKLIDQLHEENEALAKKNQNSDSHIKMLLNKGTLQQEVFDERLVEVQKNHKEQQAALQDNLDKCTMKSKVLEEEIAKKTVRLQKYELQIADGQRTEKKLQRQLEQRQNDIRTLCSENAQMKASLIERDEQLMARENGELSQLNSLEAQVLKMAEENSKLIAQRTVMSKELQEMLKIRQILEAELKTQTELIGNLSMKCREWDSLQQESIANEVQLKNEIVTLKEKLQRSSQLERDAKLKVEADQNSLKQQVLATEKVQTSYKELFERHCQILDELKQTEQLNSHLNDLVRKSEEGKRQVDNERDELEKEFKILRKEHAILQDKFNCLHKRITSRQSPNGIAIDSQLAKAQKRIVQYEEEIVPNLKFSMDRQNKIISALKTQVEEANQSCIRMREEANQLIDNTEELQRGVFGNDGRKRMPNPWSPCPPAAHTVWISGSASHFHSTPNRDSPDCYESGFQSRGTSPSPQPE